MHRHLISAAVLALVGFSCAPVFANSAVTSTPQTQTTTQLPRTVSPTHYALSLTPNAAAATFSANIKISINVLKPTSSITLNASDLAFQQVLLSSAHGKAALKASKISVNAEEETATFHFAHPIAKGSYTLDIAYTGVIGTQANGLFSVDYDTAAGHKRAIYTQFENSDARRLIPSWDEPAYKATFALEVTVPSTQMAVSNMPITSKTDLPDGRSVINFGMTPKMSTYLLFFGLGDFERATDSIDGTEVGVITQKGSLSQAAFPLAASKAILHEYNDYFGVRFPLPKLDNVAAPGSSQFFSAMENWGAIFTFEHGMLLDPSISTQGDKEVSFIIVAHEMAHQWFGDLVTMRWWDDLWLNEGFASWMENRMTERLHPEWNTKLGVVDVHESAMGLDSLSTTHPIVQRIDTVEQASQAFDEITYSKGESVIHMLEGYVGSDAWRDGVRIYMKAHAYSNTTSDDFWHSIEKATNKPISEIAHDFTLQPGIPMIKMGEVSCANGTTSVNLTQAEFSRDHLDKKSLTWHVPVTAQVLGAAPAQTLVADGKGTIQLAGCGPVLINAGQTGYFRTLYTPTQFAALAANFATITPIDQLGLMSDAWSLGLAGLQPMSDFLDLANVTPLTADPQIWNRIANTYSSIHQAYQADPLRQQQFDKFAIARLTPVMAKISWNAHADDTSAIINLRQQLISTLSQLNDPATINEANRRYAAPASDPTAFPVELRKVIMSVIALHADAATWEKLHAAAQTEKSAMMKDQLFYLIATSKDPALATRALEIAISDEPGATNSAGMISVVAHLHPDLAFDFAIAHLAQVEKLVDASSRSRYLPRVASGSAEPAMVDKLNAYANAHLTPSALGSTKTAIASINYHIKVRSQRLPAIDAWLAAHK
ncbi:M1 family metallopeptidase [Solimicrobium silvestre]|uniref:Aminopeptidase n=1 Tax=Solimicrobium silvestre TaxID=2099400 RepID=A0A2S9H3V6_9BURK|nr:M1 family metallopeptidase [Solimicrobium silvestre]PRC94641.1 Aminopeptidase N [Solimicrobium silvestre]